MHIRVVPHIRYALGRRTYLFGCAVNALFYGYEVAKVDAGPASQGCVARADEDIHCCVGGDVGCEVAQGLGCYPTVAERRSAMSPLSDKERRGQQRTCLGPGAQEISTRK